MYGKSRVKSELAMFYSFIIHAFKALVQFSHPHHRFVHLDKDAVSIYYHEDTRTAALTKPSVYVT